ncbi:hypothetical protein HDU96_000428 [Phlyctochytrium bullatum]|nr:hypothetical protein HDU96_000428 [Phlyctochytrium bullatum]
MSRPLHQVNQPHLHNGYTTTTIASWGHNEVVLEEVQTTPHTYPVPPSVYATPLYPLNGCFWDLNMVVVAQHWPHATVSNPVLETGEVVVTTTDTTTGEQVAWKIPEKKSRRIPIIDPVTKEEVAYQPTAPASSPPPVKSCPKTSSGQTRAWTTSKAELVCIPVEVRRRSRSEPATANSFHDLVERDSAVELDTNVSKSSPDSLARDSACSLNVVAFVDGQGGFRDRVELLPADDNCLRGWTSNYNVGGRVRDELKVISDSEGDLNADKADTQQPRVREVGVLGSSSKSGKPRNTYNHKTSGRGNKRRSKSKQLGRADGGVSVD